MSLPPIPRSPLCLPYVEGRQRAVPHSSSFPPITAPLQTLHMDVWGPARVSGQDRDCYFLLVVDDYTRYTTVFPLHSKADVRSILIPWIRTVRRQLSAQFQQDLHVLRLHSVRGGCSHLHDPCSCSPFMWSFAVRYSANQLNLWACVSHPETSPTLRWRGEVGDASALRVWGSLALVRDTSAGKLSPRTLCCVFLGFPTDAPPWQFYHPALRCFLSSQDVTFDESVGFYHLFPHRTSPVSPPASLPGSRSPPGVSQVDSPPLVVPLEVSSDTSGPAEGGDAAAADTAAPRHSPRLETPPGFSASAVFTASAAIRCGLCGGGVVGASIGGTVARGTGGAGARRKETLSPQQLREWAVRWAAPVAELSVLLLEVLELELLEVLVLEVLVHVGRRPSRRNSFVSGLSGGAAPVAELSGGGAGGAGAGGAGSTGAVGAGGAGTGGAGARGAGAGGTGAGGSCTVGTAPRKLFFLPPPQSVLPPPYSALRQVISLPSSTGLTPPLLYPPPDKSQLRLQRDSPQPAPSPYTEQTNSLTERPCCRLLRRPLFLKFLTLIYCCVCLSPELDEFAATCRLHYFTSLVTESECDCPPSVGDELALGSDVLEDREFELECLAAAVPHLISVLLCHEGDPDALDIPTPCSYAEAITGTYVNAVPPPGANIVDGMWILRSPAASLRSPPVAPRLDDTLSTALAALGFAPSTADPALFLRTHPSLPPFYILVYVDDLVFATADTEALALVKAELQTNLRVDNEVTKQSESKQGATRPVQEFTDTYR
ncbi:unnamed protein product [Closterium sp. NIES-53]